MKKTIIIWSIISVILFCAIFTYTHPNYFNVTNQTIEQPSLEISNESAGLYRDESIGFEYSIPNIWNEIGYSVEKTIDSRTNAQVFRFILQYVDETGEKQKFNDAEVIVAVPINAVNKYCQPAPVDCAPTAEIGNNDSYIFLRQDPHPQAWGSCVAVVNEGFMNRNQTLCSYKEMREEYRAGNKNSFKTFAPIN